MPEALKEANLESAPDGRVHVLTGAEAWSDPWLLDTLAEGMRREGVSAQACALLREWMRADRPVSIATLVEHVKRRANNTDQVEAEIAAAVRRLATVADGNLAVYDRRTPEQVRVTTWPNGLNTKVSQPENYFDIYEDLPYRKLHRFIESTTPVGSAGSCFALRIAHQLQAWRYNYVIEEDDLPADFPIENLAKTTYRMAPARCGTLFNVPSMRQMVERAFGLWNPDRILGREGKRLIDPFRSIFPAYTDVPGFLEDFERHTVALRKALLRCDVFILTLGLTEAWYFARSGDYTSVAPWRIEPALLRRRDLTVDENVSELERLFEVYRAHKPGVKLLVSVSPVPLNKSFSSVHHVVAANALSKATLRVAAERFCASHPGETFYFPSYEVVTSCTRNPWEPDMRHVSSEAVGRVMSLFRTMFLTDQETPLPLLVHDPVVPPKLPSLARRVARRALQAMGLR